MAATLWPQLRRRRQRRACHAGHRVRRSGHPARVRAGSRSAATVPAELRAGVTYKKGAFFVQKIHLFHGTILHYPKIYNICKL